MLVPGSRFSTGGGTAPPQACEAEQMWPPVWSQAQKLLEPSPGHSWGRPNMCVMKHGACDTAYHATGLAWAGL